MKKYLFGILAIALAIGFSAFTTKKAPKPYVSKTFYYVNGNLHQRIADGVTGGDENHDFRLNSISEGGFADFTTVSHWSETANSATLNASGSYINYIVVDKYDETTDSNDDNGITLQQALTAIKDAITANGTYATGSYATGPVLVDQNANSTVVTITCAKATNVF